MNVTQRTEAKRASTALSQVLRGPNGTRNQFTGEELGILAEARAILDKER